MKRYQANQVVFDSAPPEPVNDVTKKKLASEDDESQSEV